MTIAEIYIYFQTIRFAKQIISGHIRRVVRKPKCCLLDTFKIFFTFYSFSWALDYKDLKSKINIDVYIHIYCIFWQRKAQLYIKPFLPTNKQKCWYRKINTQYSHKLSSNKMLIWVSNRRRTIPPHQLSGRIQISQVCAGVGIADTLKYRHCWAGSWEGFQGFGEVLC